MARLCQKAQILGFRTNHSLRAIAASRLIHASIDEQLIMERTGHRSIEGVRSYKRTSDDQREVLFDILNSGSKELKLSVIPQSPSNSLGQRSLTESDDRHKQLQPMTQHLYTSQSLAMNIYHQTFTFNSCSVNINYYNTLQ